MDILRERYASRWTEDSERIISTPSPFAVNNLLYVQESGQFRTLPGYFTEREGLNSYLMVYTLRGQGTLRYHGNEYTVEENRMFFIDCMKYHLYRTHLDRLWEMVWVHFNGHAAKAYYELFLEESGPVFRVNSKAIPDLMRRIVDLQKLRSLPNELIGARLLTELITECYLGTRRAEVDRRNEPPSLIDGVIRDITERYQERLTLDELARAHAVSKYHMAKQFKRYTGFSPNDYLINTRITKAKELLKYTDLSIAEVAAEVGIDNASHFINLFKDRAEDTPLVFRRKWQHPKET